MRALVLVALTALAMCGCASEAERYAWNRAHLHVCSNARQLTPAQIDQIARLVAHATRQNAIAISTLPPDHSLRRLDVTTAFRGALTEDNPDRDMFGFCMLERAGETWKVTEVATDLDPVLAYGACAGP